RRRPRQIMTIKTNLRDKVIGQCAHNPGKIVFRIVSAQCDDDFVIFAIHPGLGAARVYRRTRDLQARLASYGDHVPSAVFPQIILPPPWRQGQARWSGRTSSPKHLASPRPGRESLVEEFQRRRWLLQDRTKKSGALADQDKRGLKQSRYKRKPQN